MLATTIGAINGNQVQGLMMQLLAVLEGLPSALPQLQLL